MPDIDLNKERALAVEKIKGDAFDFTAKYYAVAELHKIAEKEPAILNGETVSVLEELMGYQGFARQRQGFFLFRETANTLGALISNCRSVETAERVLSAFKRILSSVSSHAHRAAAEALGVLPISVKGPRPPEMKRESIPSVSFGRILEKNAVKSSSAPVFYGRSLAIRCQNTNRLLVIKLARPSDTPEGLAKEILWMDHIRSGDYRFSSRFEIPESLYIDDSPVFRLNGPPVQNGAKLHPKRYAIAFSAHPDYYTYPNEPETAKRISGEEFAKVMRGNAFLAGKLASNGVVHSALIPLFHNRVQVNRRRDQGLYEWFRAGRLDQWLRSCDHPNMGVTGLRDFEHLFSYDEKGLSLYRHIGSQFLSFMLVVGSYFRNRDEKQVGIGRDGKPVDARTLFDRGLLEELVPGLFKDYFKGFVGEDYRGDLPFDVDRLVVRMIDEMGVDRFMEEILRVADQNRMRDDEFVAFLTTRGFDPARIAGLARGQEDIVIHSGPHLGGFNERISLPELIEAVAAMSGMCIAGRYWKERFGSAATYT